MFMVYFPGSGGLTSIDYEGVSGDIIGRRGGEKNRGAFQVLRTTEAAQGYSGQERFFVAFDDFFGHVRGEPAGRDGIDLDIVHAPFAGEIFGEDDHATFAGAVTDGRKLRRRATQSRYGGDVNNFSAALRDHGAAYRLRKQERSGEIGFDDFVPLLERHGFDGRAPGSAGVVDEDVYATEFFERGIGDLLNAGWIFDITGER